MLDAHTAESGQMFLYLQAIFQRQRIIVARRRLQLRRSSHRCLWPDYMTSETDQTEKLRRAWPDEMRGCWPANVVTGRCHAAMSASSQVGDCEPVSGHARTKNPFAVNRI